ncbi:hypothetical protein NDU88_006911 [Pleurodeles waltl]|uniref:Uncharacterized protein n=1 Tax=Pleurodeles waltl TaxID=8319 RepID=A0AAV7QMI1_PLEWA|nr:hypothetical protein NDU88_006911 [Pleurodeles waltl]
MAAPHPWPRHRLLLVVWGGQGTPWCVCRFTRPEAPVRTGGASHPRGAAANTASHPRRLQRLRRGSAPLSGLQRQAAGIGPKQSSLRPGSGTNPREVRSPPLLQPILPQAG